LDTERISVMPAADASSRESLTPIGTTEVIAPQPFDGTCSQRLRTAAARYQQQWNGGANGQHARILRVEGAKASESDGLHGTVLLNSSSESRSAAVRFCASRNIDGPLYFPLTVTLVGPRLVPRRTSMTHPTSSRSPNGDGVATCRSDAARAGTRPSNVSSGSRPSCGACRGAGGVVSRRLPSGRNQSRCPSAHRTTRKPPSCTAR